jgi:hypothetical protein
MSGGDINTSLDRGDNVAPCVDDVEGFSSVRISVATTALMDVQFSSLIVSAKSIPCCNSVDAKASNSLRMPA